MCGIAGFFSPDQLGLDEGAAVDRVGAMLGFIRHRGPDEAGVFVDGRAALGAVRLAILDLAAGQQPMGDASGRYVLVYNGEVYNYRELAAELEALGHRLRTSGDTEVVLHAWMQWGEAALARFDGPFAFALYDRDEASLVLARDRHGKRPLHHVEAGGAFVFGSELKAFLAHPDVRFTFDEAALATIFTLWTPLPHQTAFRGISQVLPGHVMRVGRGGRSVRSYLDLAARPAPFSGTLDEAAEAARALLADAVRIRLRSDVEVATYLSGGLDSAIVTHLALENGAKSLASFSIAFDDAEFDESADQAMLARHFGTRHETLGVAAGDVAAAFPDAVWHAEVPVFRTAFVPMFLLSRRVEAAGIKVVLTGEGADEAFLGYDLFKEAIVRGAWQASRDSARLRRLYPYLPHFQDANVNALAAIFDRFAVEKRPGLFSHELRFHNSLFGLRLLRAPVDGLAALEAYVAAEGHFDRRGPIERAQWIEDKTLLAGYLVSTQGDRMSMAHGVETRCPFLDPGVGAWADGLPQDMKLGPDFDEKLVLKRAFVGRLPPAVLAKAKRPYRAPDAGSLLGAAGALPSHDELGAIDVLDAVFCRRFLDKLRGAPQGAVGQRESQALVFLSSLVLLHRFFVARRHPGPPPGPFEVPRRQSWK